MLNWSFKHWILGSRKISAFLLEDLLSKDEPSLIQYNVGLSTKDEPSLLQYNVGLSTKDEPSLIQYNVGLSTKDKFLKMTFQKNMIIYDLKFKG